MKKIFTLCLVMLISVISLMAQKRATRPKRATTGKTEVEVKDSLNLPPQETGVKPVFEISDSTSLPVRVPDMYITPEMGDSNIFVIPVLTDFDGNTYNIGFLGTQTWMTQNLRTTKYNDGTPITLVTANEAWIALKDPAYCWYSNNTDAKEFYGALYNWYAVSTGKLCPAGWHVPSDAEWTSMEINLQNNGYNYDGTVDADLDRETNNKIAKALASESFWAESINKGSIGNMDYQLYRNKSRFTALPGGFRKFSDGSFEGVTRSGFWWSDTESDTAKAWCRSMNENDSAVTRTDSGKTGGYSVRCVKD